MQSKVMDGDGGGGMSCGQILNGRGQKLSERRGWRCQNEVGMVCAMLVVRSEKEKIKE